MKKLLVIVMLMMAPVCMFGQKFGHINSSDLIPLMPDYTQAETEMQTTQSEYEEELKYLRTEYEKKIQDYESQEATLPENIKTRRQQEIIEMQDKLTSYYQECQVNLERKQAELMGNITNKVLKAIETVGQEGGFICIFDLAGGAVPFVSTTLTTDVSPLVKEKLGIK